MKFCFAVIYYKNRNRDDEAGVKADEKKGIKINDDFYCLP